MWVNVGVLETNMCSIPHLLPAKNGGAVEGAVENTKPAVSDPDSGYQTKTRSGRTVSARWGGVESEVLSRGIQGFA